MQSRLQPELLCSRGYRYPALSGGTFILDSPFTPPCADRIERTALSGDLRIERRDFDFDFDFDKGVF